MHISVYKCCVRNYRWMESYDCFTRVAADKFPRKLLIINTLHSEDLYMLQYLYRYLYARLPIKQSAHFIVSAEIIAALPTMGRISKIFKLAARGSNVSDT